MAAAVRSSKKEINADINITPLVDVVLVLLIIFMVVSPGDSTYIPDAIPETAQLEHNQVLTNEQIILELLADGSAKLDQKEIQYNIFYNTLKNLLETRTDKKIFISTEDALPYGEVISWMGLAKKAGATLMALKIGDSASSGH